MIFAEIEWGSLPDWVSAIATVGGVGIAVYAVLMAHDLVKRHDKKKDATDLLGRITEHSYSYFYSLIAIWGRAFSISLSKKNFDECFEQAKPMIKEFDDLILQANLTGKPTEVLRSKQLGFENELSQLYQKHNDETNRFMEQLRDATIFQSQLRADVVVLETVFGKEITKPIAKTIDGFARALSSDVDTLMKYEGNSYEKYLGDFIVLLQKQYAEMYAELKKQKWKDQ